MNYFAVGHASECFGYIQDWVEKKIRRHLMRARKRKGFGWTRWSRQWLYETLKLFWHDGAVLIERTTTPMRAAARVLLDRGLAYLADVLEMVRRGSDQVNMRGTIGDAAGPDDNADPLGIGNDPACYSGVDDDGVSTPTPNLKPHSGQPRTAAIKGRIVADLDGNRRVITDAGDVQWILQVQRSDGSWSNRSYCRTREALIRCCGGSTPELDALPDRIGDRVAPGLVSSGPSRTRFATT